MDDHYFTHIKFTITLTKNFITFRNYPISLSFTQSTTRNFSTHSKTRTLNPITKNQPHRQPLYTPYIPAPV